MPIEHTCARHSRNPAESDFSAVRHAYGFAVDQNFISSIHREISVKIDMSV